MSGNQQTFQKAMNNGHSAAWEQSWEQAAKFYQAALEEIPDQPAALTSLGLALYEMHDYAGALKFYQRAAAVSADDPIPHEKMAHIYEKQSQLKKAVQSGLQAAELQLKARDVEKSIQSWVYVLGLDPENRIAHTRLALIYEKLGRKPEAVKEYIAAASLMQRGGEAEKAKQIVQYCLQLVPGSADAQQAANLLKTGQMLPKPNRPRGGTGSIKAPASMMQLEAPTDQPAGEDPVAEALKTALVQLADLLFEESEDPAASLETTSRKGISQLAQGLGSKPLNSAAKTRILLHLGQAIDSQTKKDYHQAAAELDKAVEVGLNKPAVSFDLGYLLADHDPAKALRYLQKSVKHPDYALASYLIQGQILSAMGRLTEAATSYLQALRLADATTVPADCVDELNQIYEQVIESQTHTSDPTTLKTICETVAGQLLRPAWRNYLKMARTQLPPQAEGTSPIPLAEMLLESRSGHVIESQATVRNLAKKGLNRSAMEEAYYALQYAPTYLPLHVEIGELLLKEGHISEAVDKFLLVAQLYSLRGEASQAIQLLKRVSTMAPVDISIRQRLIELLVDQGRIDEAIEEHIALADVHYRLAELNQARQTYFAALRLTQQSKDSRYWAGQVLLHMADIDLQRLDYRAAVKTFEQLRTLEPDPSSHRTRIIELNLLLGQETAALTELDGYLYLLENSNRKDEAVAFLKEMVESKPEQIEIRRRLADRYRASQQNDLAIEQLDAIADSLLAAGNQAAARKVVELIVSLNPSNVDDYRMVLQKMR